MELPLLTKFKIPTIMEPKILPEERAKLAEFRSRVHLIYPMPDFKLLCWLRARDLDLDKAEQMLKRHIVWRRTNEISELFLWQSPKVFFPYLISGFDREGAPIVIAPAGRWDMRGCIEAGEMLPALKFILQSLETLSSAGTLAGIFNANVIFDFEGFSYYQITHRSVVQGIIEIVRLFESNYPEVLKVCHVVNAPKIFYIVFALVKPILHSRTLSKIQIHGSDKTKWSQALLKNTDKDQLPPHYGGTKAGRDEFCSEAWFQESLPPNYYRKIGSHYDENGEEWIVIKVNAGEDLKFDYYVEGSGSRGYNLKWAFRSEDYNVGFSVVHENGNVMVEYRLVESHKNTEKGRVRLQKPGRYILTFHNSYSRSRSKIIHYRIALRPAVERKVQDLVFPYANGS